MDNFVRTINDKYQLVESESASISGQAELFNDAYINKPGTENIQQEFLRRQNAEIIRQLEIRQAELLLAQQLLIETIYLRNILAYYQQLYSSQNYPYGIYSQSFNHSNYGLQYQSPYYGYQWHFSHPLVRHRNARVSGNNHSFSQRIISAAKHNVGQPVWAFSKFASLCQWGYLGCAATVSELLQESGIGIKGSASVAGVANQLNKLGWHKIKISNKNQFHAGDIVYGLKGSHAHIGIITSADKNKILVCDNSSKSGTLKERSIENGGSFTPNGRFAGHLYVLRKA